jgi:hypothetical protein
MSDSAYGRIQGDPVLSALYQQLLRTLNALGEYDVETKKSSLHITHGAAFLGVHARTNGLLLNIVTDSPLIGDRVRKVEQLSARRCHNEVLVTDSAEFDAELAGWLREAYQRGAR